MKKASHPTSRIEALCDHFDTGVRLELHETDVREVKLLITADTEAENANDTKIEPIKLSLYREDAEQLARFIEQNLRHIAPRNSEPQPRY